MSQRIARRVLPVLGAVALAGAIGLLVRDTLAAPGSDEVVSAGPAPAPLAATVKLQRLGLASGNLKISTGALGEPVTVTPRQLYVSAQTHAKVEHGAVLPAEGTTGVAVMEPKKADAPIFDPSPRVTVTFRPLANKMYFLDCAVDGTTPSFSTSVANAASQTTLGNDGHLIIAVPKQATAASIQVRFQRTGNAAFSWYGCEITPVN